MDSVSPEALVIALSTIVRPTSAAAVFALLSTARPTRLLVAYIVTGFVFSAGVGIALVALLGVSAGPRASDEVRTVIDIVLGAVSLGYVAGLLSGWVQAPVRDTVGTVPGLDSGSWLGRQLTDLSVPRAALVGVLTHLPGLLYLAALDAITKSTSSDANRIFQVVVYNAIWFALPGVALLLAARRPVEIQEFLRRLTEWTRRHEQEIMITTFGLLGGVRLFHRYDIPVVW